MFSAFFATYAVLSGETAGGPSGKDLFNLTNVAIETAFLLISSFTCGIATIGARARRPLMYYGGMALTFVFGAGFLFIEIHEFVGMIAQAPGRAAAPSCRRFSLSSAATASTSRSASCGCSPWSHRCSPRATGPTSSGASSASAYSGTPSTLSGWRFSPWSICWERADEPIRHRYGSPSRRRRAGG